MILLFKLILLTFIIVMGLKIAMSKGMLLEKLGDYFENKVEIGHKIFDLFICPWCMSTLQSITAHGFAFALGILPFQWDWQLLARWPLVVMGTSFLSGNAWNIYETINQIKERNRLQADLYEKQEQLAHWEVKDRKANHKQKTTVKN